jgi:hypothetical protein
MRIQTPHDDEAPHSLRALGRRGPECEEKQCRYATTANELIVGDKAVTLLEDKLFV